MAAKTHEQLIFEKLDKKDYDGTFLAGDTWQVEVKQVFATALKGEQSCNQCEKDETYRCPVVLHQKQPPCPEECATKTKICPGYIFHDSPVGDCKSCGHEFQHHNFKAGFP